MKNNILIRVVMAAALLILAVPVVASAQIYNRYDYNRDNRYSQRDVRDAIARLDNLGSRLQADVNFGSERRVLGGLLSFRSVDNDAVYQVRDFRRAVRDLRNSSRSGRDLDRSVNEARAVVDQGVALDRYLRLRTGRTNVDADLAEIRSELHVIADAYGLSMRY